MFQKTPIVPRVKIGYMFLTVSRLVAPLPRKPFHGTLKLRFVRAIQLLKSIPTQMWQQSMTSKRTKSEMSLTR